MKIKTNPLLVEGLLLTVLHKEKEMADFRKLTLSSSRASFLL